MKYFTIAMVLFGALFVSCEQRQNEVVLKDRRVQLLSEIRKEFICVELSRSHCLCCNANGSGNGCIFTQSTDFFPESCEILEEAGFTVYR